MMSRTIVSENSHNKKLKMLHCLLSLPSSRSTQLSANNTQQADHPFLDKIESDYYRSIYSYIKNIIDFGVSNIRFQ